MTVLELRSLGVPNEFETAFQAATQERAGARQYGLVERGHQLGWSDVQVIDDDLGRSGVVGESSKFPFSPRARA